MLNAIHPDEDLTNLILNNYQVLQKKQGFRFAIDAILLAHFAPVKKNWRICDVGTGTGVIPLVLTSRSNTVTIDGIEIQEDMADMAGRTIAYNDLSNIQIINDDVTLLPKSYNHTYDMVISNPPYFPLNAGKMSPIREVALARHEITCTLSDLINHGNRLLKSNGHLVFIHRPQRLTEIFALCAQHHLTIKRLRFIHPSTTQEANLVLIDAVKGAGGQPVIEPPLVIYDEHHEYTKEILAIYQTSTTN